MYSPIPQNIRYYTSYIGTEGHIFSILYKKKHFLTQIHIVWKCQDYI